jgi:LCP family protein required for cell wall assembly
VRRTGDDTRADRRPSQPAGRRRPTRAATRSRSAALAPDDTRRTIAAAASAVIPGLGQLINGRTRLARWFAIPALVLLAIAGVLLATNTPARLFASLISPTTMAVLLALNVVVLAWRLAAVMHAFFDSRYSPRSGRMGAAGLALIILAVAVPHGIANAWGSAAQAAFSSMFAGTGSGPGQQAASTGDGPGTNERINILVVGVDSGPNRTETLTDSMMVVSIDPVGTNVSLISVPRDITRVPLGNGNVFGPKVNSLMSYADRHPEQFPGGGMRALEGAVGALLGLRVDYYARIDFVGFVKLIDSVGGVDVNVTRAFFDPRYSGRGVTEPGQQGWGVTVGLHHFDGDQALAYARSRYAPGESDFTRAARQQQILVALRQKLLSSGDLLMKVPSLFETFGSLFKTDVPPGRLPDLAAIADELPANHIYQMVVGHPLVKPANDPVLGSIQVPDIAAIQAAVQAIAPPPGGTPVAWPTPRPKSTPRTSPAPAASVGP